MTLAGTTGNVSFTASRVNATKTSAKGGGGAIFIFGAGGLVYELSVEVYNNQNRRHCLEKWGVGGDSSLGGAHKLHRSEKLVIGVLGAPSVPVW